MTIKPVLVPDHDAVSLRGLMDRFAEATTAPVEQQLTESAESGVAEESENLAIGEKMARDGIEYDPAREGEIISMIGDYLRRDGMTTRQVRGYMIDPDFISDQLSYLPRKSGVAEADVPYNDPNLSKAYTLGNEAYTKLKNHPELAQAAQDRIEKEFPQYARMWLTGYRDGERFDQEKSLKESRDPVADLRRLLG